MKTISTLTNEVIPEFNYDVICSDYVFYHIDIPSNKDDAKNYYKAFYTEIKKEFQPAARFIHSSNGKKSYIIAIKKDIFINQKNFSIKKLGISEIKSIPKRGMLSMMLSMMLEKSSFFELVNNPYDIFYTHTVAKNNITALRIELKEVDNHIYLNLGATNFKKVAKKQKGNMLYIEENGILLPYCKEKHTDKTVYQKGNFKSSKTTVPFLNFSGKDFSNCKTYFYHSLKNDIEEYLSKYMSLNFQKRTVNIYTQGSNKDKDIKLLNETLSVYIKNIGKLHIANFSTDEQYSKKFFESFSGKYGLGLKITCSTQIDVSVPNISITMPKSYYDDNKEIVDPYKNFRKIQTPIQNITTETDINDTIMRVLIKELALKCELHGYQHLIEHQNSMASFRYFSIEDKEGDIFYKSQLSSDGKIITSPPTDKEQYILEDAMFHITPNEVPEYVVMSESDDIMVITRLAMAPLPNFNALVDLYEKSLEAHYFSKEEILEAGEAAGGKHYNRDILSEALTVMNTSKGISSVKLMALSQKIISKSLKNALEKKIGRPLRFLPRGQKELFSGMIGINYGEYENSRIYHTGLSSANLNTSIDKNSPYRKITALKGKIQMGAILPLMEYYFVKNNELTVIPYPVKYAREGYLISNPGGDNDN